MRAIVTGAASGIGAALARGLLRDGWTVAGLDRDAGRVDATVAIAVDVADEAGVAAAIAQAADALGGIDGLATCAGVIDTTPTMDATVASCRRLHDVNVVGTFLCVREAVRRMSPGARIVTVASIAGLRGGGLAGNGAYAASKGAVLALSRNLARELGPRGIAVNCVAPGPTETPMTASTLDHAEGRARLEGVSLLGRVGTAEEIAAAIAWLLSPHAAFVHGATLVADGGATMA